MCLQLLQAQASAVGQTLDFELLHGMQGQVFFCMPASCNQVESYGDIRRLIGVSDGVPGAGSRFSRCASATAAMYTR